MCVAGTPPPSSQGPPMAPAEGGPKILKCKSSWHRRRRSKTLAVSLKHWKRRRGGGPGGGGVTPLLLRCTAVLIPPPAFAPLPIPLRYAEATLCGGDHGMQMGVHPSYHGPRTPASPPEPPSPAVACAAASAERPRCEKTTIWHGGRAGGGGGGGVGLLDQQVTAQLPALVQSPTAGGRPSTPLHHLSQVASNRQQLAGGGA